MSKLADRIRRVTRVEAGPIGFAAAAARSRPPSLLLCLQLADGGAERAKAAGAAGADVLILPAVDKGATQAAAVVEAAGDAVVGLWPAVTTPAIVEQAKKSGVDFLVIDMEQTPAALLLEETPGFVLLVPEDLNDMLLRAMDALPLDAVLLSDGTGTLTIRRQLELRRLHGLTQKPLLVTVPADISGRELEALRDIGVVGVVITTAEADGLDRLKALRAAIDALPPRRRRREEAPVPLIPRAPVAAEVEEEEGRIQPLP